MGVGQESEIVVESDILLVVLDDAGGDVDDDDDDAAAGRERGVGEGVEPVGKVDAGMTFSHLWPQPA